MQLRFIYFDLGQVLVRFDHAQMLRQISAAAGVEVGRVQELLFADGMLMQLERGTLSTRQFYDEFCRRLGARPDYDRLARAASEFFAFNDEIAPVVMGLRRGGWRLGILSNTSELHWEYCRRQFALLSDAFAVHVLSYRVGAIKPEPAIYAAAVAAAGCRPAEIFFTDDILGHVLGARAAGFDAVQFTGAAALCRELAQRGIALAE